MAFGGPTSGTVEGQVLIARDAPVELADPATQTAETYAGFLLIIRSAADGKEVARVTPDRIGKYRIALPPGDYVLALQREGARPLPTVPQKFSISANKAVRVDVPVLPNLTTSAADRLQSD